MLTALINTLPVGRCIRAGPLARAGPGWDRQEDFLQEFVNAAWPQSSFFPTFKRSFSQHLGDLQ
jgi:hypothetical protein